MKKFISTAVLIVTLVALAFGCAHINHDILKPTLAPTPEPTPIDMSVYALPDVAGQYDILPLLNQDETHLLAYAGFKADGTVVTMHVSKSDYGYVISELDIEHGRLDVKYTGTLSRNEGDSELSPYGYNVISIEPFAFVDDYNYDMYMLSEDYAKSYTMNFSGCVMQNYCMTDDGSVYGYNSLDRTLYKADIKTGTKTKVFETDYRYRFASLMNVTDDGKYAAISAVDAYDGETRITLVADLTTGEVAGNISEDTYLYTDSDGNLISVALDASWSEENSYSNISIGTLSAFTDTEIPITAFNVPGVFASELYICQDAQRIGFMDLHDENTCRVYGMSFSDDALRYFDIDQSAYVSKRSSEEYDTDSDDDNNYTSAVMRPFASDENGDAMIMFIDDYGAVALLYCDADEAEYTVQSTAEAKTAVLFDYEQTGNVDYGELSEKAKAVGEKYNVTVLLGKNACLHIDNFNPHVNENKDAMKQSIETLDAELAKYPSGFLDTLREGYISGIVFCFTGRLKPANSDAINTAAAVTTIMDDYRLLLFDVQYVNSITDNVHHEIAHMIDGKLSFSIANESEEENAIWSSETWNALNPEGFSYNESYFDSEGVEFMISAPLDYTPYAKAYTDKHEINSVYFLDTYAKTFATEDRAMLFAAAMDSEYLAKYLRSTHITAKLTYYFTAIRHVFDPTDAWGEETFWEANLAKIIAKQKK